MYDDAFEWSSWQGRGDPVVHIDLGKWADMMVIAPLDANSLAKISQVIFELKLLDFVLLCEHNNMLNLDILFY